MIDLDRDLAHMLKHSPDSVKVVYGEQRTHGYSDVADEALFADIQVKGAKRLLTIRTGSLTSIAQGTTITVGGTDYTIVGPAMRTEDGRLTMIPLGNA